MRLVYKFNNYENNDRLFGLCRYSKDLYNQALYYVNQMLKDKFITKDELISFKKKLIKKYKPIISVLEEIDEKDN